jgi:hypothetical protein
MELNLLFYPFFLEKNKRHPFVKIYFTLCFFKNIKFNPLFLLKILLFTVNPFFLHNIFLQTIFFNLFLQMTKNNIKVYIYRLFLKIY